LTRFLGLGAALLEEVLGTLHGKPSKVVGESCKVPATKSKIRVDTTASVA